MKLHVTQFCICIFCLFAQPVNAETLTLKDGTIINGIIKSIGTTDVVISTILGDLTIEGSKILKVEKLTNDNLQNDKAANSLLLSTPEQSQPIPDIPEPTFYEMHVIEKNGWGFGATRGAGELLNCLSLFYDLNYSESSQFHFQLDSNTREPKDYVTYLNFGEAVGNGTYIWTTINTTKLLSTYRYFPYSNSGFYVGAGGGLLKSTFKLISISTYNSVLQDYDTTKYSYNSQLTGVFVLGELGWQGKDGFFFHISFQPTVLLSFTDNYDVNNIPNATTYKNKINDIHDNQTLLHQIVFGIGWFF